MPATERLRYPAPFRTVLHPVRDERLLRQRMLLGATGFGCFSVLWTSVAFLLSGVPYHDGNSVIGLFGLARWRVRWRRRCCRGPRPTPPATWC